MNQSQRKLHGDHFRELAKELAQALRDEWKIGKDGCWWVGNSPMYDTFLFDEGGGYTLSLAEMAYSIEQGVTYEEAEQWSDYNARVDAINKYHYTKRANHINLKSWHEGAPRLTDEQLNKLEQ